MKFNTTQGQTAYQEIISETGRVAQEMRENAQREAAARPKDSIFILMRMWSDVAHIQLEGLSKAINTGTNVDVSLADLASHLATDWNN